MQLEFRSKDHRFGLVLGAEILASLNVHCSAGWPLETGGILVGRYTPFLDRARVTKALPPPPDSRHGPSWLVRGTAGFHEILAALWQRPQTSREYYLGEWHLHPGGAPSPSVRDRSQMQEIADALSCSCPEPILLIVGGSVHSGWSLAAFVFPRQGPVLVLQPVSHVTQVVIHQGRRVNVTCARQS